MKKLILFLPILILSCKKDDNKPFEYPKVVSNDIEIRLDGKYLLLDAFLYMSLDGNKIFKKHFNDSRSVSKLKPNSYEPFDIIKKGETIWSFESPNQNFAYGKFTVENDGVVTSLPFYVTPSNWSINNKPLVNARLISPSNDDTIVEFTTYTQTYGYNNQSYHFSILRFKKIK